MALIREIDTPYGPSVKARYHTIVEVLWRKGELLQVQMAGHATKEDRAVAGSVALGRVNVTLPGTDGPPSLKEIYDGIKKLPDWKEAADG